ncbi:1,2-dihydroxy-3-keto-5-methylthiopentene dioxygenase [Marasmius crinis-equi]|uniref:1,2-dihydroxy-3-keto-5-methylthiopentene dioxygenase n=1 Tax=Marasmius crinis-equi TaxID=585013 RepID=A0ABR3EK04_9AGAR
MRAYYRHATGDFSSPQDSGRPVSEEELRALGVKWWEIDGSHEERMKEYRELSKNLGFTDDGYEHLYDLRNPGGGMPHNTDMVCWLQDTSRPQPYSRKFCHPISRPQRTCYSLGQKSKFS